MTSRLKKSQKRKKLVLSGLEALNSFKVPKKVVDNSLLENVALDSVDYLDEIHPQLEKSFKFPQLSSSYFQISNTWLVHNRTLEDVFSNARKRVQKSSTDTSLCTGFLILNNWSEVESMITNGIYPGNDADTWLGKPHLGFTVNQCADLTAAFNQSQFNDTKYMYMVIVRWVRTKAYIVSACNAKSSDRLEPQPGYACHVSTWSRMDLLDPIKMSLKEAFQLAQVYLYEFDEDLELKTKLEHVIPYAVVQCKWTLKSSVSCTLPNTLTALTGSIMILPDVQPRQPKRLTLTSSGSVGLLPIPTTVSSFKQKSKISAPITSITSIDVNYLTQQKKNYVDISKPLTVIHPTVSSPNSQIHHSDLSSPTLTDSVDSLTCQARKFQQSLELSKLLGHSSKSLETICFETKNRIEGVLVSVGFLTWGYPKPIHSLPVELHSFRKGLLTPFDGILQPCFPIQRLVSQTSFHYELAGLNPCFSKPLSPNGPPLPLHVPFQFEWCLPRFSQSVASSMHNSSPSVFAGYRANYFRMCVNDSMGSRRTDMAQLCQTLQKHSLVAVVPMTCDESSLLFLFPESSFSQSIGLPPTDSLDTNSLHSILLTPHNLKDYPYHAVRCLADIGTSDKDLFFKTASPSLSAPCNDEPFDVHRQDDITDHNFKLSLNHILSSLPDSTKNLVGNALISLLINRNSQSQNNASNTCHYSRLDPRISRHLPILKDDSQTDIYSLACALFQSPQLANQPNLVVSQSNASCPPPAEAGPSSPDAELDQIVQANPKEIPLDLNRNASAVVDSSNIQPCDLAPPDSPSAVQSSMEVESVSPEQPSMMDTSDMEIDLSLDYHTTPMKLKYKQPAPIIQTIRGSCDLLRPVVDGRKSSKGSCNDSAQTTHRSHALSTSLTSKTKHLTVSNRKLKREYPGPLYDDKHRNRKHACHDEHRHQVSDLRRPHQQHQGHRRKQHQNDPSCETTKVAKYTNSHSKYYDLTEVLSSSKKAKQSSNDDGGGLEGGEEGEVLDDEDDEGQAASTSTTQLPVSVNDWSIRNLSSLCTSAVHSTPSKRHPKPIGGGSDKLGRKNLNVSTDDDELEVHFQSNKYSRHIATNGSDDPGTYKVVDEVYSSFVATSPEIETSLDEDMRSKDYHRHHHHHRTKYAFDKTSPFYSSSEDSDLLFRSGCLAPDLGVSKQDIDYRHLTSTQTSYPKEWLPRQSPSTSSRSSSSHFVYSPFERNHPSSAVRDQGSNKKQKQPSSSLSQTHKSEAMAFYFNPSSRHSKPLLETPLGSRSSSLHVGGGRLPLITSSSSIDDPLMMNSNEFINSSVPHQSALSYSYSINRPRH